MKDSLLYPSLPTLGVMFEPTLTPAVAEPQQPPAVALLTELSHEVIADAVRSMPIAKDNNIEEIQR